MGSGFGAMIRLGTFTIASPHWAEAAGIRILRRRVKTFFTIS
jgi:hypothetical protein